MSATHPFTGLVVIDFTHVLAGPACSHYLGLLGAKVIKVETPVSYTHLTLPTTFGV